MVRQWISGRKCEMALLYIRVSGIPQVLLMIIGFWLEDCMYGKQLDELWSFIHTKERNLLYAKTYCETYGIDQIRTLVSAARSISSRQLRDNTHREWV